MLLRLVAVCLILGTLVLSGWKLSTSRSFQFYGGLVTRVETDASLVALTFDDGPTPAGTDAVLPLLGRADEWRVHYTGSEQPHHR